MSKPPSAATGVEESCRSDLSKGSPSTGVSALDFLVVVLIVCQAVVALCLPIRSDDFFAGDTTYFELARSWLDTGSYGFNGNVESLFPPGFPAILVLLCVAFGCQHVVMIRAMVVFTTLGLLVSYALLRRLQSRGVAAACCLLLAFSPEMFELETRYVYSDLPYFFTSLLTLLVAIRADNTISTRARVAWGLLSGVFLVLSLMIRSAGISLLAGLLVWLFVSSLTEWQAARRRLALFLPILLVGLAVQGTWMHWSKQHENLEWQLPGFPMSYVAQLEVKDGHHPELGLASLSDLPARVTENLIQRAARTTTILTHHFVDPKWYSLAVCGPVILILIGLGYSLWPRGGEWSDWYFLSYEAMYLLWPWDTKARFLVPVIPLAGMYLWRGGAVLFRWTCEAPRIVGAVSFPLLTLLAVSAFISGWDSAGRLLRISAIMSGVGAAGAAWIAGKGKVPLSTVLLSRLSHLKKRIPVRGAALTVVGVGGVVVITTLCLAGLVQQLQIGRENLVFDVTQSGAYPDIEAALWIQSQTSPAAIVMARHVDVVYHYSRRKTVWFPPLSNPQVLMNGIQKHHVEFIIVIDRKWSYWLPREQEGMQPLLAALPESFHLVHEGHLERVFAVVKDSRSSG